MATVNLSSDPFAPRRYLTVTVKGESVSVHTWADGYGTWHAEFTATQNTQRDARVAREAIAFELACREGASAANHLRVSRRYRRTDLPGHRHYAEVIS